MNSKINLKFFSLLYYLFPITYQSLDENFLKSLPKDTLRFNQEQRTRNREKFNTEDLQHSLKPEPTSERFGKVF